jgi:hypothetical protein
VKDHGRNAEQLELLLLRKADYPQSILRTLEGCDLSDKLYPLVVFAILPDRSLRQSVVSSSSRTRTSPGRLPAAKALGFVSRSPLLQAT